MKFKPMLSPNEKVDLDAIKYPILTSTKLDGIRCIFHPELGIVSRSLKSIPNLQLKDKFKHILEHAQQFNLLLDGEIYAPNRSFQEITRAVMTQDFTDEKTIKKLSKELNVAGNGALGIYIHDLIRDMEFHCFDVLNLNVEGSELFPFKNRSTIYHSIDLNHFIPVEQIMADSKEKIEELYGYALSQDCEGLILKDPEGKYKFGRGTLNEGLCYKVKPFETFDAKIIDVTERFENTGESFRNELGDSVKHNFKDNKEGLGIAAAFLVELNSLQLENKDEGTFEMIKVKVILTGSEAFRRDIWENKESYIGKMIEFKGMIVGAKEAPRHPVFLRFRKDKTDDKQ